MWSGEWVRWWETLDVDVPQISRNGQSNGETRVGDQHDQCDQQIQNVSTFSFFPSLPVIPCNLASIFTRQIYLTNPAPGQSRKSTKSNELFKSVKDGIKPSMKLRSIYNGVTRTMQAICTIRLSVLWSFSQTTQKPPVTCFKTCDGYLKHRR